MEPGKRVLSYGTVPYRTSLGVLRILWALNGLLVLLLVCASLFVDLNGDLPGLPSGISYVFVPGLFTAGIVTNGFLARYDRGHRWLYLALLMLFLVAALPIIL
jgi:hypothetical protein